MLHHASSSEDKVHMISTLFSLFGTKKAETSSSLEKAARRIGLKSNDSNHSFFDLISYPYFLLILEAGGLGGSIYSSFVPGSPGSSFYTHSPCVAISSSPLSLSKMPSSGAILYGCSMCKAWEMVGQERGMGHRQVHWHIF